MSVAVWLCLCVLRQLSSYCYSVTLSAFTECSVLWYVHECFFHIFFFSLSDVLCGALRCFFNAAKFPYGNSLVVLNCIVYILYRSVSY